MPQVELRVVESGARSTLYASKDGSLYRLYHDTKMWRGPLPPTVDPHGTSRYSHNRSVSRLVDNAWNAFRGDETGGSHLPPAQDHLRSALSHLTTSHSVDEFADKCGVKASTAWGYAGKIVEHWPATHVYARGIVYGPLLQLCSDVKCLNGTLREVMERLRESLSGDTDWRCMDDHFAHLRLARLCVEAQRKL